MFTAHLRVIIGVCLALLAGCTSSGRNEVRIVNNQPFDIRMPMQLRGAGERAEASPVAQPQGEDLVIFADVRGSRATTLNLAPDDAKRQPAMLALKPSGQGIEITSNGTSLGVLTWQLIVRPADPKAPKTEEGARSTKADFNEMFKPLPLSFRQTGSGPLFDTWSASGADAGLKLDVQVRAYHAGFVDLMATYENQSAPTSDVYGAVVCRWEQPGVKTRSLCYDNRITEFADGASTSFREGEGRHLFIQRGVDWINNTFDSGASVAWLNDFTPSFTVHKEGTEKTPPRWIGANTAQLAQEAQAASGKLYSITEVARPNLSMYRTRLEDEVLPPPGEPLTIINRLIIDKHPATDQAVDQQFVAYVGYNPQKVTDDGMTLSFGVPYTEFGTNYFPFSTLGENFIDLRMPGMSKDGYWPLAAASVNQYEKFADIIRRDLRTLKALGYSISRLHHLEVLWDKDPSGKEYVSQANRQKYLDFYFDELKKLDLTALLDVKLTPEQTAWLVKRYRPLVEGVEIDNEILIFQMYDHDVQYWKDVYAAVKKVAPEVPVHLTAHTNTGAFNRLKKLDVPFDKVGAHAYMDSKEAITSSRGYALAVANYAAKVGKPAAITEWNWRFLTRMTEDQRAKIYPPIFENVLKTRGISTMYQFQYNDGLAMNPAQLKGIRHYEQVHLSRRPKPEAIEMAKLIKRYSNPDGSVARLDAGLIEHRPVVTFENGVAKGQFIVTNTDPDKKPIRVKASLECFDGAQVKLDNPAEAEFTLGPAQSRAIPFTATAPKDALPGFYHVFLRMEGNDDLLRYGWAECRLQGAPPMDKSAGAGDVAYAHEALDFDFNRPIAVVYGDDAPIPELEAAWVIYQTLESATGRKVEIYHLPELPDEVRKTGTLIVYGTPKSNALMTGVEAQLPQYAKSFVARVPAGEGRGEWLVVGGRSSGATTQDAKAAIDNAAKAAMDLTLRYWKQAKDSGARRVGLVSEAAAGKGFKTDID